MDNQISLVPSGMEELNVQYQNRFLYSRYRPVASAERAAGMISPEPRTLYFLPSPLLGYGMENLISRLPADSAILAVETDQNIMAATASRLQAFSDHPNVYIYRMDDSISLYRAFTEIGQSRFRACRMIPLNGGYQIHKKRYDALFSALQHYLRNYWHNRLTTAGLGKLWMRNLLSNLPLYENNCLSSFRTGKPVVLAGAGESLEGTLPFLQSCRNSVFLLAVDTAVQTLVKSGLLPDGVVNLESQYYNLKDFYTLKGRKTIQFADLTAYPPSLRVTSGRTYFFSSRFGTTQLQDRLGASGLLPASIPPLGSVGVTALYVARQITDGPVFLTGLDFSYVPGKTHAADSPFHDWARLQENRLSGDVWYTFSRSRPGRRVSCKSGQPFLQSDAVMEGYGRQLEDLCGSMDGEIYDLAEKGIALNIPRLTASEARDRIGKTDTRETVPPASGPAHRGKTEDFLREERKKLNHLLKMWEEVSDNERDSGDLLPLLEECDYIYYHFPDTAPRPRTEPAFLFRAVRSAREYSSLLRRICPEA